MIDHLVHVNLTRTGSATAWGFRLEGGADLNQPLRIVNVNPGSIAFLSGLQVGDVVTQLNSHPTQWMRHEDAKTEIIRSGNYIRLTVSRGTSHSPNSYQNVQEVWSPIRSQTDSGSIHYNIHHNNSNINENIGVSHNVAPPPFGSQNSLPAPAPGQGLFTQTLHGRVKKIQHSSYNTPMGLYSKQNVDNSFNNTVNAAGLGTSQISPSGANSDINQTLMKCSACDDYIKGVFVKIQGRIPMHPGCLKCCKCGVGLRNVGYFYINSQLYCETHAKQAAPPPEPGMKPVVVYK